jgi:tripartite ATP-independent transporter DctP family solute receptor
MDKQKIIMLYKLMRRNTLVISVFTILILLSNCKTQDEKKVLKLAHGLDVSHSVHKGMVYMAEQLKKKSDGHLQARIYPSEQLGTERQCLEMLQIGSLAMTKVSAAIMENFAPQYKVLGLPYIFKDKEHAFNVLDGEIGNEILLSGEDFWLRGLTFFDAGHRSFYTINKPVEKPEDIAGLKIRVMESATAVNMIKAFGGSPTPISWGELYTALQNGVVDGAENNPPSFYLSHHYEVCKYYSIDEHTSIPDVLLISTHIYNQLSEEEKKWLNEAAHEAAIEQRKLWAISEKESIEAVKEAGVEVSYPDKGPFVEKVKHIYDNYKDEPEIYSLIQRIRSFK